MTYKAEEPSPSSELMFAPASMSILATLSPSLAAVEAHTLCTGGGSVCRRLSGASEQAGPQMQREIRKEPTEAARHRTGPCNRCALLRRAKDGRHRDARRRLRRGCQALPRGAAGIVRVCPVCLGSAGLWPGAPRRRTTLPADHNVVSKRFRGCDYPYTEQGP